MAGSTARFVAFSVNYWSDPCSVQSVPELIVIFVIALIIFARQAA
jgi:hypothetical protein